jgi:hypothetical protein
MRTFNTKNKEGHPITFKGIKYLFLIDDQGVGIRRVDNKVPMPEDITSLTQYLFEEGFANPEDFKNEE